MGVHAYNPSTLEVEAGELQVQDQSGLHSKTLSQNKIRKMGNLSSQLWRKCGYREQGLGSLGSALLHAEPGHILQMQDHLKHLKAIVQYKELLQTSQQQNLYSVRGSQGQGGWP
jgi:hypothetical protein